MDEVSVLNCSFGRANAVAKLKGSAEAPKISGTVKFYQRPGGIIVEAQVHGLPYNKTDVYGFHIHTGTSCSGSKFSATGQHYNPQGLEHPNHAGDLPPLFSCGGRAYLAVLTDRFSLREVLGRTIVIHSSADDFITQPAGNAGEKIACGVIEPIVKQSK